MKTLLPIVAVCGFAMPCHAEPIQITEPLTVQVVVTVDNTAYCSFEKAVCNDNDVVVTEE